MGEAPPVLAAGLGPCLIRSDPERTGGRLHATEPDTRQVRGAVRGPQGSRPGARQKPSLLRWRNSASQTPS